MQLLGKKEQNLKVQKLFKKPHPFKMMQTDFFNAQFVFFKEISHAHQGLISSIKNSNHLITAFWFDKYI